MAAKKLLKQDAVADSYLIRTADIRDIDEILRIESECFSSDKINRRQARYLLTRAKAITLVSVSRDGNIVGYCLALVPSSLRRARLYSIAVENASRNQGVAERLIERLFSMLIASGYQRCALEVRATDTKTQALYRRVGFEVVGELPNYYEDGADGIKMLRFFGRSKRTLC